MSALAAGRRVVVKAFGDTPMEAIEAHSALEPMEAPDAAQLGAAEAIVAVRAAAVGWVDLLMTSGQYQHVARPPYVPGIEYAGVVVAKGAEVRAAIGDEVIVDPFLAGPRSLGAYQRWGGFASYAVVPAAALLPVPGGLSMDQACCLLGNAETAYHCLIARGRLQAGETVLINGASGATGLAAVQVAKKVGATVIATGRSRQKLDVVAAHGADHVIDVRAEDGGLRPFRDEVKRLTGGRGVDVVHDGVGGDISLESLRCVAFGARFLIVGWASTPFVARGRGGRGAPGANQLPTNLVMMKGLDVLGCPTAITTAMDPSIRAPRLAQVLAWADEGALTPLVSSARPLDDYREAMAAKWRGEVVGNAVLRP
ncbi:MAG TPA: NADPH:quinone oxidoreductase family protein [Kofleriaceae bacterium]|nr:NADPH:quinone oxidoreductase family protein [Kofleriaceae bacterium]